jgi:general secretion pathway protein B
MSLILDALRKLDREKSSRRKGGPNIASEILRPDSPREREKTFRYVIAFSLTALVTAGLTYAVVIGVGSRGKSLPPASSVSPGPNQPAVAVPAEPGPASQSSPFAPASPPVLKKQAATVPPPTGSPSKSLSSATARPPAPPKPAEAVPPKAVAGVPSSPPVTVPPPAPRQQAETIPPSREPARDARSDPARAPANTPGPGISKAPAASPVEKKPSPFVVPKEVEVSRGDARKPGVQAADESSSSPPPLKITGIVWNEEPSRRRAVINGSFITEGSLIEGVKVVEIHPTKIRFQYKGQPFEITVF